MAPRDSRIRRNLPLRNPLLFCTKSAQHLSEHQCPADSIYVSGKIHFRAPPGQPAAVSNFLAWCCPTCSARFAVRGTFVAQSRQFPPRHQRPAGLGGCRGGLVSLWYQRLYRRLRRRGCLLRHLRLPDDRHHPWCAGCPSRFLLLELLPRPCAPHPAGATGTLCGAVGPGLVLPVALGLPATGQACVGQRAVHLQPHVHEGGRLFRCGLP